MADDPKDTSIDGAINDSIEEVDKATLPEDDKSHEEGETEETEEVENDKDELEEEEADDDELSDVEKTHALNLYKSLKDPAQRETVLRVLASDIIKNVSSEVTPTKSEKKELSEVIEGIVSKNLGENYKFLAKGLSGAIKEALDVALEEKTAGLKNQLETDRKQKLKDTVDGAMQTVFGRYSNIDERVQKQILKMMDTIKPSQDADPKEYFENLAHGAASRLGIQLKLKNGNVPPERTNVIKRNRNDASLRLASERGGSPNATSVSNDKLSIDDAVKKAVAAVEKQK